ncbi:hypothetical protein ABIE52_003733 [Rhodococcus sp. OAS809]|uniref:hypothetical protein n=1 Tax=Rhodococcus sp. OAS809 TaxID=2663874 RepID=UPI00178A4205
MSWQDFEAWLTRLPGRSAYRRLVDPMGVFTDPEPDLMLGIMDEIRTLQWQFAGAKEEHVPRPMAEILRQSFAKREQAKLDRDKRVAQATEAPKKVIDIREEIARRQRGEMPTSAPKASNPKALEIREKLARAKAANQ